MKKIILAMCVIFLVSCGNKQKVSEISFSIGNENYEIHTGQLNIVKYENQDVSYQIHSGSEVVSTAKEPSISFFIKDKTQLKTEFTFPNEIINFYCMLKPDEKIYEVVDGAVNLWVDGELTDDKGKFNENIIVSGTFDVTCAYSNDTIKLTNGKFKYQNGKGSENQVFYFMKVYK